MRKTDAGHRLLLVRLSMIAVLLALASCNKSESPIRQKIIVESMPQLANEESTPAPSAAPSAAAAPVTQPPQPGPPGPRQSGRLAVPGHQPAEYRMPSGSTVDGFRVAVAAHGAGGRGVDHCEHWDSVFAPDVLIVCPTGTPMKKSQPEGAAYFQSHVVLHDELTALVDAVKAEFGEQVQRGGWLYLGYSQGATMGALAIVHERSLSGAAGFAHLVLVEGGGENWTDARANQFQEQGGRQIALICGTRGCKDKGTRAVTALEKAGLKVVFNYLAGGGHAYWGAMGQAVAQSLSALGFAR